MTSLASDPRIELRETSTSPSTRQHGWPWQYYVALLSIPFLVWEFWTLSAWLAKGPHEITQYRNTHETAWVAARVYEPVMIVISLVLLAYVIRGCLRLHRLSFDAMLVISCFLMAWLDPLEMFFQPVFLYSSDWTNLNSWCSQVPGVVNPDCSRIPEPIIFLPLVYTFGVLACTMIGGWVIRKVRTRYPGISFLKVLVIVSIFGVLFDIGVEYPMILLHLWNYPGFPNSFSLFSGGIKLPLAVPIGAALFWGGFSMVRNWKDDRGQTIFERGLDRISSPKRRTAVALFALIAFSQVVLLTADWECAAWGLFSSPYTGLPASVVNGVCNTAGFTNTRYGPCPGSPGYKMPVRTLPGPTP